MRSIFELKTQLPFDENVFNRLKKTAVDMLESSEEGQYTQAIVLLSSGGNEYGAVIKNALSKEKTEEAALIEKLNLAKDTEIRCALCMWQDGDIDIPSFAFRKMLYELNVKNDEALLYVMTQNGVSVMKLATAMK